MEEYFIDIQKDHFSGTVKFWFIRDDRDKRYFISIKDGAINETSVDYSNGLDEKTNHPLFEMPSKMASVFLEQIQISAKEKGINIKAENIMQGKLEAKDAEIAFLKEQLNKFINKATR